jgi:hypothetical protein
MIGIGIGINYSRVVDSGGGTPPVNTVAPVISAPYYIAGQTITTTDGTWSGTTPITFSYQWQVSANGVSGWINVGTNSNTILISSGSSQLLFYRCVVTASNGIGSPMSSNSNVAGGVDSEANTHFNRVTTDSGVMTYGLIGVDTYVKSIKYIYNVSTLSTKFVSLRQLDYLGYKAGSGSGTTAGRAVQKIYSALGASGDYIQNTTTAQPALGAWSGTNYIATFNSGSNKVSTPNNVNNQLLNNLSIEARISGSTSTSPIVSKTQSTTNSNFLFSKNLNFLRLSIWQSNVRYNYDSTTTSSLNFVRVSRNSTTGIIKFFDSSDGINWTQVGTDVSGITGTLDTSTATILNVGHAENIASGNINIFYLNIYKDDSFTTATQICNISSYNRLASQTTWVSTTGETWTLNADTTATGLKIMLVDQTMIQGNGTTMGMQAASLSINTLQFTEYNVWRKFGNATTAGSNGILKEFGSNIGTQQGIAFIPNENANTESLYTTSNSGLNGTSWQSNSLLLKVSTFEGDINGLIYEQNLLTNNVQNTFNAVQAGGLNTTAIVSTAQNLLARNNAASLWLNAIWVADALTITTDTSGEKAGMYNLLATESNII